MQTIRADHQIPFGGAAVFELDPHPVLATDHPDRAGVVLMRSVGKPASSRSSRTRRGTIRTGAPSRSTIAVRSTVVSGRPVDVTTRTVESSLTCPVHIDAELLQNRRAVGPDGHRPAAGMHAWPPFEDGDVMSVAQ